MLTEFSVIIPFQDSYDPTPEAAKDIAVNRIKGSEDWYGNKYYNWSTHSEVTPVMKLDTAEGQSRVQDLLGKTQMEKAELLEKIIEQVEDSSIEEAATDYNTFHNARRLGAWRQTSGHIIDGTRYARGEPALNEERVANIVDHHDEDGYALYLVNLTAKH